MEEAPIDGDQQEELQNIQKEWEEACNTLLNINSVGQGKKKGKKGKKKKGGKKTKESKQVLDLYEVLVLISPKPSALGDVNSMKVGATFC